MPVPATLLLILCLINPTSNAYPILLSSQSDSLVSRIQGAEGRHKVELALNLYDLFASQKYTDSDQLSDFMSEALVIASESRDSNQLIQLYGGLGVLSQRKGELKESLDYFIEALELSEKIDNKLFIRNYTSNVGVTYLYYGNTDKALEYTLKALDLTTQYDLGGEGGILLNLGLLYRKQDNLEESIHFYQRALRYFEYKPDSVGIGRALTNMGVAHMHQNKLDIALGDHYRSLSINEKMGFQEGICYNRVNIGEVLLKQGRYSESVKSLLLALEISNKNGFPNLALETLSILAEAYSSLHDFEKAFKYQSIFIAQKDSLFNQEKIKQMAELEAKYAYRSQKKEIELLKVKEELQEAELKEKQTFFFILIECMVLVALALVFFVIQNQTKRKANEQLSKKNEMLAELYEKLLESENELRSSNLAKDKFFSIISHDLKSPINSLSGLLYLLQAGPDSLSDQEFKVLIARVHNSVKSTEELLNNLLQWSTSQLGKISFSPSLLSIEEVVNNNIDLVRVSAETKNIILGHSVEPNIWVMADIDMLNLIVRNLLYNALKFTPRGGRVLIVAERKGGNLSLSVIDSGIGIEEGHLKKLFSLEYQLNSSRGTENESGTGLGLILCKEFVEKNGGEIKVESIYKTGTTFTVMLPIATKPNGNKNALQEMLALG